MVDPLALAQALIRCPSVTPEDAGALGVVEAALKPLGFECHRLRFAEVENLYARLGGGGPNFCFAGHTDVVPPGDRTAWAADPFSAELRDGRLYGRGAADMKGGIAAFLGAIARFLQENAPPATGAISLLITGDEEGPSINGTKKVLEWLAERGERLDACVVGEPTNPTTLGDMIKIGRRGSLTGYLTVTGTQGHVAYPHLADNPLPRLVRMLAAITAEPLDEGSDWFQPSTLQITTVDVGNPATNVIPSAGRANFNIRFNDLHSSSSLTAWLRSKFDQVGGAYELRTECSGESFLTEPGPLSDLVAGAVEQVVGRRPELSTTGGTSDARFIRAYCPVVEFGIVGQTMHKIDEHVQVADLEALTHIYTVMLRDFFARSPAHLPE